MGAQLASGGKRTGIVGINITPMVDIMLVLLVIMMVSATYIVSQSLKVELPKSASSDESVQSPAIIVVGEVVELSDAEDKLARWARVAEDAAA